MKITTYTFIIKLVDIFDFIEFAFIEDSLNLPYLISKYTIFFTEKKIDVRLRFFLFTVSDTF